MIITILCVTLTCISLTTTCLAFYALTRMHSRYKLLDQNLVDSMIKIGQLEKDKETQLFLPEPKTEASTKKPRRKKEKQVALNIDLPPLPELPQLPELPFYDEKTRSVDISRSKYLDIVHLLQSSIDGVYAEDRKKFRSDLEKFRQDTKILKTGVIRTIPDPRPKKAPAKRKKKL